MSLAQPRHEQYTEFMASTDPAHASARRKLPLWRTVKDAHLALLTNVPAVIRVLALPLLLLTAATAALEASYLAADQNDVWRYAGAFVASELLVVLVALFAAVQWHRFLLLGARPTWLPHAGIGIHWSYATVAVAAVLAITLPVAAGGIGAVYVGRYMIQEMVSDLQRRNQQGAEAQGGKQQAERAPQGAETAEPPHASETAPQTGQSAEDAESIDDAHLGEASAALFILESESVELVLMALPVVAILVLLSIIPLRISLALPAIAIGQVRRPVAHAWAISRGNFWRLLIGSVVPLLTAFVILAPIAMGLQLLDKAYAPAIPDATQGFSEADAAYENQFDAEEAILRALGYAATPAAKVVFGMIWVGFLSLAYRALSPSSDRP